MRLLVVDDDIELCLMLGDLFRDSGFRVDFETDGAVANRRMQREIYDLLILDVMLPGEDGFAILRRVRAHSRLPVLMLTAKNERRDRLTGFELGADDYLAKPFYPEELLARVQAILRRATVIATAPQVLTAGDIRVLPGTRHAYFRGKPLDLTAMECEILEQLVRSSGRVVSRDDLSLHIYQRPASPFDRSIDTHVSRIRRKLGEEGSDLILSVRGTGYQLRYQPDAADQCNHG
jgi:two-component system, OmpR family, response regulator CpxR